MARINIEDSLYKDNRFYNLCLKMGSKKAALGALVEAWTLAQKYVTPENPEGITPFDDWQGQDIAPEILEVGLAKKVSDDEIKVSGGLEQFDWLVKSQLKGRKGGEANALRIKEKPKKHKVSTGLAQAKHKVSQANPLTLTLTPTLPLTLNTNNNTNTLAHTASADGAMVEKTNRISLKNKEPTPASQSIKKIYFEAFEGRYGSKPAWSVKENTLANRLIASVGHETAFRLAEYYPSYIEPWHVKQRHPFALLVSQVHKVLTDMQNAKHIVNARTHEKEFDEKIDEYQHKTKIEELKKMEIIENMAFEIAKKEFPDMKDYQFKCKEFLQTKNISLDLPFKNIVEAINNLSKQEITHEKIGI